jgi:hypothetical protein
MKTLKQRRTERETRLYNLSQARAYQANRNQAAGVVGLQVINRYGVSVAAETLTIGGRGTYSLRGVSAQVIPPGYMHRAHRKNWSATLVITGPNLSYIRLVNAEPVWLARAYSFANEINSRSLALAHKQDT